MLVCGLPMVVVWVVESLLRTTMVVRCLCVVLAVMATFVVVLIMMMSRLMMKMPVCVVIEVFCVA